MKRREVISMLKKHREELLDSAPIMPSLPYNPDLRYQAINAKLNELDKVIKMIEEMP